MQGNTKIERTLSIYRKLTEGQIIKKSQEADTYKVNERSIQRDIEDIRDFLEKDFKNTGIYDAVVYDRSKKGYRLERLCDFKKLTNGETLSVCKILLDSRALNKKEMEGIIEKLIENCVPLHNKKSAKELIDNELFNYVQLRHGKDLVEDIWNIGQAIKRCRYIEVDYMRIKDKKIVRRKLKPVGLIFSEYYFYLTALIEDKKLRENFDVINDAFPTIYRIDRIQSYKVTDENFYIPYKDKFEEGEFRKRIQFMFAGKLERVKFKYFGNDIDSILDRLPTAKIIEENENYKLIEAEVFGKGIDMWLRSQGDRVEVLGR